MVGDDDLDLAAQHLAAKILHRHLRRGLAADAGDISVKAGHSRMPPSFSGGFVCASADVADTAKHAGENA